MKNFIRQYPNDRLAQDARYWLGETYNAREDYAEATAAFAEAYARYPYLGGTMTSEVLLKLSISAARSNQKQNACSALAKLLVQLDDDFANREMRFAGNAINERAKDEKKKLGC
jgi:TolA-binding protein